MEPEELLAFQKELDKAFRTFDWRTADDAVREFADSLRRSPQNLDANLARKLLARLRRKRRFESMRVLTGAFPLDIAIQPQVWRQSAQSLIEQGKFAAAEDVLLSIVDEFQPSHPEVAEARGLLGRIYKQMYVNANAEGGPFRSTLSLLQRAIDEYTGPYTEAPATNHWHGINLVACLDRARRDGMALRTSQSAATIARAIYASLTAREAAGEDLYAFEHASLLECLVAFVVIKTPEGAEAAKKIPARAATYLSCDDADAFEVASTLRQLLEVWQLTENQSPGSLVLPILRAGLLNLVGGSVEISASEVTAALQSASEATEILKSQNVVANGDGPQLEKKFLGGYLGLDGWKLALERTPGVARIERSDGLGIGTGWLVDGRVFFPGADQRVAGGHLLITNAHVVGPNATSPRAAKARFQDGGATIALEDEVVWTSPPNELDVTFLRLKNPPAHVTSLPVSQDAINLANPPQFLYIIGHPGGGNLAFSLHDNAFLARNERLLHYRTPTEGGSSGSPVFDPVTWEVVALHHAGATRMTRLDGAGIYEANEGICVCAIRQQTARANV